MRYSELEGARKFIFATVYLKSSAVIFEYYQIGVNSYSWTPLCRTRLSRTPRSLEQNRISLGFTLVFQPFTMGYLELGYLEHPAIWKCFSLPLAQTNPGYLKLHYDQRKHWSTSVRKCSQGTSWQDVLKAEKMYWPWHGSESKVRLTGLTTVNAEGDKLPVFVNFRDQTITPEIWRQPRYLKPPLSLESSR